MNKSNFLSASLVAVAMIGGLSTAHADSADATCQVRKDGETKKGMSGPCTFSQRQGYIDLDLRNGETFSLSPTGQPNQFKDQKGKKVVRTQAGGDTQEFKWEGGKKVVVTFGASQAAGGTTPTSPAIACARSPCRRHRRRRARSRCRRSPGISSPSPARRSGRRGLSGETRPRRIRTRTACATHWRDSTWSASSISS